MSIDVVFFILAILMLLLGTVGTVVPILPGVPLAWLGLLISHFSSYADISIFTLVITGIIALIVSIADNFFPSVMTKKSGGSKQGSIGSMIGTIVGFF